LTIIGAVLPIVLGATLGSVTDGAVEGSLANPMPPSAFLWLSIGLVITHLLILAGHLAVARLTTGQAHTFTLVAAVGTAAAGGAELWAGLIADADRNGGAVAAILIGYFVCSVAIAVGTVGAGVLLWASARRLALPLLVNGLFFGLVAVPVRFLVFDVAGVAMLTVWGLTHVWLGVVLLRTGDEGLPVMAGTSAAASFN